jgi:plastocyanin
MNRKYSSQQGVSAISVFLTVIVLGIVLALFLRRAPSTEIDSPLSTPSATTSAETFPTTDSKTTEAQPKTSGQTTQTQKSVTVKLTEQNGSRQSGEATLTDSAGKTKVVIALTGKANELSLPTHIHSGSCSTPGDIRYQLTTIEKGSSVTTLDLPLSEVLKNLPVYINVHKSATELQTSIACGTIPKPVSTTKPLPVTPVTSEDRFTVRYNPTGFSPKVIEIKLGEAIKFVNNNNQAMWVASNDHPTHTLYPGFDEGKSVGKNGTFIFTFTEAGTWGYHNHNKPGDTGTIIVK